MKKIHSIFTLIAVIALCFIFSGSASAEDISFESLDFEQTMLQGESEKFLSIQYWRSYTDSSYMREIVSAESSNPDVVEVTLDTWVYVTAKSAGSAVITLKNEEDTLTFPVTVLGEEQFGIKGFYDMTMNIGDSMEIGDIEYFIGDTVATATASEYLVRVSDESVVKVLDYNKSNKFDVKGVGEVSVNIYLSERPAVSATFKITVPALPSAEKPKVASQVSLAKKTLAGGIVYSDHLNIGVMLSGENVEYEIYMSDKKKKGYKKIGWVKTSDYLHPSLSYGSDVAYNNVTSSDGDSQFSHKQKTPVCITVKKFKKKKLKANKRYYIKIRARYTDKKHSNEWSAFSDVKEYWTAPAPIAKKNIKYNSKTGKLSFPKVKNAAGYYYGMSSFEFIGYNVFGGRVYFSETRAVYTTKNSFTAKKISGNDFAEEILYVIPCAKHNGYYYKTGYEPFKKAKKHEYYDGHRWAGG